MEKPNRELRKGLFITKCLFPYGSAISSRVRNLLKLLIECGYEMHIITPQHDGNKECDELIGYNYTVDYIDAKENRLSLMGIGFCQPYIKAISSYLNNNKPAFILSTNMPFATAALSKAAHQAGCKYLLENCEWFDASSFKFGILNPYYRKHIKQIRGRDIKMADGIIAISRLLEEHYSSIPVIRIPTILDVKNTEANIEKNEEQTIKIVFAGSLGGGKENLKPIFEALSRINSLKRRIELDIYGPSKPQVLANIGGDGDLLKAVEGSVAIKGRVSQKEISGIVKNADYSIFIRPERRSSNAGFPTKLAESMCVGTPVITNNTGDISLYLNEKNGFLLESGTSEEIEMVFQKILSSSQEERNEMRKQARQIGRAHV